jgi:hypothetical protein
MSNDKFILEVKLVYDIPSGKGIFLDSFVIFGLDKKHRVYPDAKFLIAVFSTLHHRTP